MKLNETLQGVIPAKNVYGYIPGLDGIRAIAVMFVLVSHFEISNLIPGGFGVTLFFFISGFLITRLLLAEMGAKGSVSLKKFYLRRFIRLYPALIMMIGATSAVFFMSNLKGPVFWEFISSLFYFANIYNVFRDIGLATTNMSWRPLWSLAVEEHFYLVFPLLLICFGAIQKKFINLLLVILLVCPIWRIIINATTSAQFAESYTYMMSDCRIDSILWGCLLSLMLNHQDHHAILKRLIGIFPILFAIFTLLLCFLYRDVDFRNTIRFSLQGFAIFILILNLYFLPILTDLVKLLDIKPLAYIGVLSYGLYLWHFPVIDWFYQMFDSSIMTQIIGLPTTFLIAHISYRYVETPFIKLRKRYGAHVVNRAGLGH